MKKDPFLRSESEGIGELADGVWKGASASASLQRADPRCGQGRTLSQLRLSEMCALAVTAKLRTEGKCRFLIVFQWTDRRIL